MAQSSVEMNNTLLQRFAGVTAIKTPVGGATIYEYADVTNAATVGGIEVGTSYNCALNTTTGVWAGRDVTEVCWLEKWSDAGGLKQIWYAPIAAAGVVPTWQLIEETDLVNTIITQPKTMTKLPINGSVVGTKFENVASYSTNVAAVTGTLVFGLGTTALGSMATYVISGYDYGTKKAPWKITVSGYFYGSNIWTNTGFIVDGNPPFAPVADSIRVGIEAATGNGVILLGAITTVWSFPIVFVDSISVGYVSSNSLKVKTQTISFAAEETAYTVSHNVPEVPTHIGNTLNQRFAGLVSIKTPVGGAPIREFADIPNAANVGGIETGVSYNCDCNPTTGAWLARDVPNECCWLEKWSDVGGLNQVWYAEAGNGAPVWSLVTENDVLSRNYTFRNDIIANTSLHMSNSGMYKGIIFDNFGQKCISWSDGFGNWNFRGGHSVISKSGTFSATTSGTVMTVDALTTKSSFTATMNGLVMTVSAMTTKATFAGSVVGKVLTINQPVNGIFAIDDAIQSGTGLTVLNSRIVRLLSGTLGAVGSTYLLGPMPGSVYIMQTIPVVDIAISTYTPIECGDIISVGAGVAANTRIASYGFNTTGGVGVYNITLTNTVAAGISMSTGWPIEIRATISGTNMLANTTVTSNGTGVGGVGTYNLSLSQTVANTTSVVLTQAKTDERIVPSYTSSTATGDGAAKISFATDNAGATPSILLRVGDATAQYGNSVVSWGGGITIASDAVYPTLDAAVALGTAALRWGQIYSSVSTISTSDARQKTNVLQFSTDEINAAKQMSKEIGTYQFLASITEKGLAGARIHIGMTVQRVMEIMVANNLDPMRYGFICYDKWDNQVVNHQEVAGKPAEYQDITHPDIDKVDAQYMSVEHPEVCDENGITVEPAWTEVIEISPEVPAQKGWTEVGKLVTPEVVGQPAWTEVVRPAGDAYGFRYEQLTLFIAKGLEARLTALEAKVV